VSPKEVLLASVTPFDLVLGKLLACCGVAALVGALYLALGLGLAQLWRWVFLD
jgi:ABC-type Na+ efflux pump permease subunit